MGIESSVESKDPRGAQRGRRTSPHARTNEHVRSFEAVFFGGLHPSVIGAACRNKAMSGFQGCHVSNGRS